MHMTNDSSVKIVHCGGLVSCVDGNSILSYNISVSPVLIHLLIFFAKSRNVKLLE